MRSVTRAGSAAFLLGACLGCGGRSGASPASDTGGLAGSGGAPTGGALTGGLAATGSAATSGGAAGAGGPGSGGAAATGGSSGGASSGGASSGGGSATGGVSQGGAPPGPTARIRVDQARQTVEGFGFSTAWGNVPTADQMDAFFSVSTGAGMTILRNRIPFRENNVHDDRFVQRSSGGTGDYVTTVVNPGAAAEYREFTLNWNNWDLARTRALIADLKAIPDYELTAVFSTPWTPPNNDVSRWKLDVDDYVNHPEIGGTLDPNRYDDYADLLADYVLEFEAQMGAPLAALSLQNEPSFEAGYESCDWTATQIHDFLGTLAAQWTKKGVFTAVPGLTLIAPEHNNFRDALIHPSLDDPTTSALIGIAGGHLYEYGWAQPDPLAINFQPMTRSLEVGKRIWMTEWNVGKFGDPNQIGPSLALAKAMNYLFTEAGLNAFIYWWAADFLSDGAPNKALFTMAQHSRFVRPGWHRVVVDGAPASEVLLSAFVSPDATRIAIVAVNMGRGEQTFSLQLSSGGFGSVTPYRTSASENAAALPDLSGGSWITVTLPGESVTTFAAPIEE